MLEGHLNPPDEPICHEDEDYDPCDELAQIEDILYDQYTNGDISAAYARAALRRAERRLLRRQP